MKTYTVDVWRSVLFYTAAFWIGWFAQYALNHKDSEPPPKIITEVVGTNAFSYMRPPPSRKLINGTQDRYIDWPYPPLRTNMCLYFADRDGIAYLYLCNDGQVRWEFKEAKP